VERLQLVATDTLEIVVGDEVVGSKLSRSDLNLRPYSRPPESRLAQLVYEPRQLGM
jgi:hypothetical protein